VVNDHKRSLRGGVGSSSDSGIIRIQEGLMRNAFLIVILGATVVGCAHAGQNPTVPVEERGLSSPHPAAVDRDGSHRLWGEFRLYFDETHTKVDAVPVRSGRFHLNVLKFLEEYCTNCLQITSIHNNGDGTIDLTVRITHPFPGLPQYTGFDVKGIIMFNGSWTHPGYTYFPPYPEPFRVSWRKLGDPQVLNADGYTLRWSPSYESGLPQPVFNYWEGRYAKGVPTANLNAYLDFYTDENRHMFRETGVVSRTYRIWLPPGPIVAGYAVEACWEPPLVTPVTDPASDFPPTANQPEAYRFYLSLNNGEPITDPNCCGKSCDPSDGYYYSKQWGGHTAWYFAMYSEYYRHNGSIRVPCSHNWPNYPPCPGDWPEEMFCGPLLNSENFPDGDYMGVAINYHGTWDGFILETSYSVFEFTIDFN
jgi:hypothetical protein